MSAKSVIFMVNSLLPSEVEETFFELVEELAYSRRYKPVVACLKFAGERKAYFDKINVPVYHRLIRHKYDFAVVHRLFQIFRRERVSIVIPVGIGDERVFWGVLAGKLAGAKVIVWSHAYPLPGHSTFELFNRLFFPSIDKFIAFGRRHKVALAWRDKVPEGKIEIVPAGVKVERFDHPEWRDKARAILGLADDKIFAIGMTNNLIPSSRHDVFVESAKKIVKERKNVHFFIIGDGPNAGNIKKWARESELLGHHLSLLGHREDIPQILPGLDLVCICSEYQLALSSSALQAIAAGVPVLSNVIGSMDEIIEDGKTGFFYHPLTVDTLVGKILELLDNRDVLSQVARNAKLLVKQKFRVENMRERFINIFDSLLTPEWKKVNRQV